jgi:competence protein ComEA
MSRIGGSTKNKFGFHKQQGVFMKSITIKSLATCLAMGLFSIWAWAAQAVNVNSASAEEIAESLKGVGLSKAEAIVNYRSENGKFKHVDELVNVKGIGIRTVDINRKYILLEKSELAASK